MKFGNGRDGTFCRPAREQPYWYLAGFSAPIGALTAAQRTVRPFICNLFQPTVVDRSDILREITDLSNQRPALGNPSDRLTRY